MRGSTGCVLSRCLLAHSPARRPGAHSELSALGPGPSSPSMVPAVPGSEQTPREESGPVSVAMFSLWCPVCVSPPSLSRLMQEGPAPQERQAHADHTGAVEVSKPRPCLCFPSSPPFSLILSDACGRSHNEVTPLQTWPLVSLRSLLHLLGLRLFRGAGTVYPRDAHSLAS